MTVHLINPRQMRHKKKAQLLLKAACDNIEIHEHSISGYLLMVWDDKGATSLSAEPGGPISLDLLPVHAFSTAQRIGSNHGG